MWFKKLWNCFSNSIAYYAGTSISPDALDSWVLNINVFEYTPANPIKRHLAPPRWCQRDPVSDSDAASDDRQTPWTAIQYANKATVVAYV